MRSNSREEHSHSQTTVGPIRCNYISAMEADDTASDCKTETVSPSLALAGTVDTIEGAKDRFKFVHRNPRTAVADTQLCLPPLSIVRFREEDLDNAILRCVAKRIAQDVFQRAFKETRIATNGAVPA